MRKFIIGGMTFALLASCATQPQADVIVKQVPYKSVFLLEAGDPLHNYSTSSSAVAIKTTKIEAGWETIFLTCVHSVKVGAQVLELYIVGNNTADFPRTNNNLKYRASVVALHPTRDLAIISCVMDEKVVVATPVSDNIELGQEVYSVGYPMGANLSITTGFITDLRVEQDRYVSTAPSFFGNSGGAIFDKETGNLIGILSNIYRHPANAIIPNVGIIAHMTLFESLHETSDWRELWQSQRS